MLAGIRNVFKLEGGVGVACPQIERRRRAHKLSFKQRRLGGTSLVNVANDSDNENRDSEKMV